MAQERHGNGGWDIVAGRPASPTGEWYCKSVAGAAGVPAPGRRLDPCALRLHKAPMNDAETGGRPGASGAAGSAAGEAASGPATASSRVLAALSGSADGSPSAPSRARPPVWIMRQAGRYLPEYQELRARHGFVEMCSEPDLAFEISMQPRRRFELDAVIVFYDILFLAEAMGAPLEYNDRGPVFLEPLRDAESIRRLRPFDPQAGTPAVLETLRRLRAELPFDVAVLGFAGAPFTMAAYLVEGDFRRSGEQIKRMMYAAPETLRELLDALTVATVAYLRAQIEAGAGAVQLFDTWAGLLSPADYAEFALPFTRRVFAALDAPAILYVNGCAHLVDAMAASGASALSLDWRVDLAAERERLGPGIGLQGNLDPSALFAPPDVVSDRVRAILDAMRGDPRYVFNLGHGILPQTPIESVEALVETVREFRPHRISGIAEGSDGT